jgi:hypothetical protein
MAGRLLHAGEFWRSWREEGADARTFFDAVSTLCRNAEVCRTMLRNMASIYLTDGGPDSELERVGSRVVADRAWIGTGGRARRAGQLRAIPLRCVLRNWREETGLYAPDIEGARLRSNACRVGSEIRQNYYSSRRS